MKSKKFAIAALLFVTLIVVGVLVWPTPKPALANVWYEVHVQDDDGVSIDSLDFFGNHVQFAFYYNGWGAWFNLTGVGEGDYMHQEGVQATRWRVRILTADWVPYDPISWPYEPPGGDLNCTLVVVVNPNR
jgi:hypothetical protein